ncbi:NADPH:quinone oxidoreductase family protein [Chelatococcus reniformis]|uniref:NADPH:quinone oxidoreductase n=1 Tax=Chelatococcus reniformis TaxID=1494448 RepID=A0A916UAP5_9HYPH|nr:NADPH:quinone oxidoreductase family protein [Chelatococcus reniformis]GGC65995.1 NADPH:quinone oxidoreductase [Chelatococcus reniformis]
MPRAVVCRTLGTPDGVKLEELPRAELPPDQVRVAIHAAGINFPDLLMLTGDYQHKPPLPFIPGFEAAGVVTEVGAEAAGYAVGDRVMIGGKTGAFADEAVVKPELLEHLPDELSFAEGATFRVAYQTAHHALTERAHIKPGEVLLVHGAGGGVGLAAVQIGKLLGATVIACASSQAKLDVVKACGADHTILYGAGPFKDEVKRLTDGKGANVIFDPVGGEIFEQSLRCMAFGCRVLIIGFTGGIGVAKTNLVLIKGASVLGVRAGESTKYDHAMGERTKVALRELAASGKLRPQVSHTLPLEQFREGMELVRDRKAIGRVVLTVR